MKVKYCVLFSILFVAGIKAQNPNDALRLSDPGILSDAGLLAIGNSGTALNTGYSSGLMNPAIFGLNNKTSITGGFFYNGFENKTTFFSNTSSYSNNSNHFAQLGFIVPLPTIKGSMVLAAGYTRIKDYNNAVSFDAFNQSNNSMIQDLTWANDDIAYDLKLSFGVFDESDDWLYDSTIISGMLNQSGTIIDKGGIDNWNFSGSVEIARNLFVGATFNLYTGTFERAKDYYEDDTRNIYTDPTSPNSPTNDFRTFYYNEYIKWDLTGWDMKFGLLYRFNPFSQFGAFIKLPTQYTIKEDYVVEAYSDFEPGIGYSIDPYISEIEYDITTPFELGAGIAYGIAGVRISGQATLIDYTQMEFSDGLTASARNLNNKLIKENFRSVITYNIGAEYNLPYPKLKFSAGFMYYPSAYDNDPSEFDKKYFTAGFGFIASRVLAIDFAYVYGWWETYGDNYGVNVSRTFQEISRQTIVFSVSYGI